MSYPLWPFLATEDELNLATRLLEMNSWNRTESLSVDTAIGIFKQNGLSFKQLREIWSIADKDGSGKLSRNELAIVIRLMGWVQAGETLDESLLKRAGPLPKIKGIPDLATTPTTEPGTSNIQLPPTVDSDVQDLIKYLKKYETISGNLAVKFMSVYKIEPVELSKIIQKADHMEERLSPAWITMVEQHVRAKLASKLSPGQPSPEPPPSYHTPQTGLEPSIPRLFAESVSPPVSPLGNLTIEPPSPMSIHPPQYEPSNAPAPIEKPIPSSESSSASDQHFLNFQGQIERLTSQVETVALEQSTTRNDLQNTVKTLQEENFQLRIKEVELQGQLARKEVEFDEAEKLTDLMRFEVLERDVIIKECEERTDEAITKLGALKEIRDAQSKQIASLLDLVASLESTIKELHLNPAQNDLRLGFLRAEARASKAETAKAVSEADTLRQTNLKQEQELKELRALLEEKKVSSSPVSRMNQDLSTLRDDHEGLKAQVKKMQFLLTQRLLSPNVRNQSEEDEDDNTLVPGSVLPFPFPYPSLSSTQTISRNSASERAEPRQQPSIAIAKASSQLDHDLGLLRSDLQRKEYIGGETVQRLISEYGIDASFLDEICRNTNLDNDWRNVEVVVDLVRTAIVTGRGKSPVPSQYLPVLRTPSPSRSTRYRPSTSSTSSSSDEDSEEEEDEDEITERFSRFSPINPMTIGHLSSKTILKSSFKAKISAKLPPLEKLYDA